VLDREIRRVLLRLWVVEKEDLRSLVLPMSSTVRMRYRQRRQQRQRPTFGLAISPDDPECARLPTFATVA
jgi:hypothetical protein